MRGRMAGLALLAIATSAFAADERVIGLSSSGAPIRAEILPGAKADAPTVLWLGGLSGPGASSDAVEHALRSARQTALSHRAVRVIAIVLANPDAARLRFPPAGTAYRDLPEAHVLWRWIAVHAPDEVLIADRDDAGLAQALSAEASALIGAIPARAGVSAQQLARSARTTVPASAAHREISRRLARSPLDLAHELAAVYGQDFTQPIYINAIALVARLRLGELSQVQALVEPYVNGSKDSLARPSSLVLAGHMIFGELARRTHDPRYLARVRAAADLAFDAAGHPLEAVPYNDGFSDSVFMGSISLVQTGALTGERRYFDMAVRHIDFMRTLDARADGLYRHQPATDAAWGRGNAFAAIGLALALSDLPPDHPGFAHLREVFREHMQRLAQYQDPDGLWRNVIDYPGAYAEYSATAMIGFAMKRGLARGWLAPEPYEQVIARAWEAVLARTSDRGEFIDVCESTARMTSLDQYLHRAAILGPDARGGAMAMLFATEMAQLP